jgi:molybdopterin synthase sulfur carrier subunit
MTPERFETIITGVPLWLLREYGQELGGRPEGDGALRGEGWRMTLAQADDYAIGSLRVGRVRMQIEGEAEAVAGLRRALEPKLLRGGG